MPTFHLNCRRCKQAATLIIIPLLYIFGFGVPKPPSIIRNVPKLTKRDAMARFMKENDVMVRLQNTIYSRRIQSVIEREMSENRLVEETPPRKDIRRNIKQIGNKVIRRGIPNCPQDPPVLGELNVNLTEVENVTMMDVIKEHRDVRRGGLWKPKHCHSSHRVAIVIPFRDREKHLNILLYHLLPLLKRQLIDFHIFVVEQVGNTTFNKGKLMNVGFLKAIEMGDFHCVIFHDVDLIPEDDRNLYRCTKIPRHLSVGVDSLKYIMPYDTLAGGVLNMPVETFLAVNGYSNMFWGWGGEDDEMGARIYETGIRIQRPPSHIAKYKMISHKKSPADHYDGVFKLLGSVPKRILSDGLNSIEYKLKGLRFMKLYTHIWVDVGLPPDATSKGKEGS